MQPEVWIGVLTFMDQKIQRSAGAPWGTILSLLAALVYGASPIDLIPDVILILGWMDDAVAIPTFLVFAWVMYKRYRKAQRNPQPVGSVSVVPAEPVIPEHYNSGVSSK